MRKILKICIRIMFQRMCQQEKRRETKVHDGERFLFPKFIFKEMERMAKLKQQKIVGKTHTTSYSKADRTRRNAWRANDK